MHNAIVAGQKLNNNNAAAVLIGGRANAFAGRRHDPGIVAIAGHKLQDDKEREYRGLVVRQCIVSDPLVINIYGKEVYLYAC
ncbi:MAG: hypothetical protein MI748_07255 [Opitutales bacterium]|nr:hypothetical protein [Opitutales bacterium]